MNIVKETIIYENITYSNPKEFNKKFLSNALYNDSSFTIQVNKVITPFGIYKENGKYKLDLIIDKSEYIDLFNKIEDISIRNLAKKYISWFGEEDESDDDDINYDTIKCNLYSNLKSTDECTLITLPIETSNNIMNIEVYDHNKQRVHWKEIKRNSVISLILNYNGIRFLKTKFYNDWTINQIKIHQFDNFIIDNLEKNICYIDESDNESLYSMDDNLDLEEDSERIHIDDFLKEEYRKKEDIEHFQKC